MLRCRSTPHSFAPQQQNGDVIVGHVFHTGQNSLHRGIAEDIIFSVNTGGIMIHAEFLHPPLGLGTGRGTDALGAVRQLGTQFFHQSGDTFTRRAQLLGQCLFLPTSQHGKVVGTSGLGSRPHGGMVPPAERLAADNGAGDDTVDVRVAHLHFSFPQGNFPFIQGLKAAGKAKSGVVLDVNGFLQVFRTDDSQYRTEAFRLMEPASRFHPPAGCRETRGTGCLPKVPA